MSETSLLDERLAEIDERLRTLQSGLQPVPAAALDEPVLDPAPADGFGEADEPPAGDLAPVAQRLEEPPLPPTQAPLTRPTPLRAASAPPAVAAVQTTPISDATLPSERLISQLRELGEAHERLLALHRDLLYQYAEVLEQRAAQTATVSVTAGPFADGDAVRMFESGLRSLPGVSATTTREYLAGDRVAIDVRLADR